MNTRRPLGLVFLFTLVWTPQAPAQPDSQLLNELRTWLEPAEPTKIVGPIHFVGTKGLASYLITSKDGHILLFGVMPRSGDQVADSIRKLGFKPADIKILLTCHAHVDHVGTHSYFKSLTGAKVAVLAEEVELLESGGKTDFHYANYPLFRFPPVKVDRVLRDGDRVTIGDVSLTAHRTPGHTKGGTTWTTTVVEGGKAYSVVFPDGSSINPGYRLEKHPSYPGIADDFRRTFHAHEMLKPDIWLHSHTSFFDFEKKRARAEKEGVKAWVDPEGYRKFVIGCREKFEKTIDTELAGPDIGGPTWRLVRIDEGESKVLTPGEKETNTVEFRPDGKATVRIGGKTGTADWKLGGWSEIELGDLAVAHAPGPETPAGDRVVKDWTAINRYEIRDGKLVLSVAEKGTNFEFAPSPAK